MTEQEWFDADTPNSLLNYLQPWRRHGRRFRLFVCAWYRHHWNMLNEPCRNLIDLCEQSAIYTMSANELVKASRAVARQAKREWAETGADGLAEVGPGLLRQLRLEHLPGWEGMPPPETSFVGTVEQREANEQASAVLLKLQVVLLREIFGNPFRPASVDVGRLTAKTRVLVREAYDDRGQTEASLARDRLTGLANALETSGGIDNNLLRHLRSEGPHVLGCWAVEQLRGQGLTVR